MVRKGGTESPENIFCRTEKKVTDERDAGWLLLALIILGHIGRLN
jgi:hypothetical protein